MGVSVSGVRVRISPLGIFFPTANTGLSSRRQRVLLGAQPWDGYAKPRTVRSYRFGKTHFTSRTATVTFWRTLFQ